MSVEALLSLTNQFAVKMLLAPARFIAGHQQDRLSFRVERKSDSPFSTRRAEPKLLQIRATGSLQRVDVRSPESRPELLEKQCHRQQLRSHFCVKGIELHFEFVA